MYLAIELQSLSLYVAAAIKRDLKPKFIPEPPKQISLSASAIETYISCPLKYRLSRIDRIPQTASKPELVFGNIIHKVLQRFHNECERLDEKSILRLLDEEWQSGAFEYKVREEKFKEQGIKMLSDYVENIKTNTPNVIATELSFKIIAKCDPLIIMTNQQSLTVLLRVKRIGIKHDRITE